MKFTHKKVAALSALALVSGLSQNAMAALDPAVTAAITTAQGDIISLLVALTTAGAAIWVATMIYRRFKVR